MGFEFEIGTIKTQVRASRSPERWRAHHRGQVIKQENGFDITADRGPSQTSQLEFIIKDVDEDNAAACRRAVAAAREIVADIRDVTRGVHVGTWVRGSGLRMRTSRSHRFQAQTDFRRTFGQLQATAGLSIARLPEIVSGRAVNDRRLRDRPVRQILGNYNSRNIQPIWHNALQEARNRYGRWTAREQEVLASAVTIIAQVPLAFHNQLPGGQALFTAKTDFSKVMAEVFDHLGRSISQRSFERLVMGTINRTIRQGLNPNATLAATDDMYAVGFRSNNVLMNGLSIRRWLRGMLPRQGRQGVDLFTPDHFPGTRRQREELRGFGRLGNRVDAGNRPIFEFRNLSMIHADQLPAMVEGMLEYARVANNPPRSGWWYAAGVAAVAIGLYGAYHAVPWVYNRLVGS